ncbi:MAG: hypothetical protein JW720_08975 [Sedimentisphaerales bacterium]|nr:hypothetical protein [Sedimentisphaerales bacterium]
MDSDKKESADREQGESAAGVLEKLTRQLHSSNASIRRQAAFNLSWMQEDGMELLKETLFGNLGESTKNAAAYGLRKMRGRMKKLAMEALRDGLKERDKSTREVCRRALELMGEDEKKAQTRSKGTKRKIQSIGGKGKANNRTTAERRS